MGLWEMGVIDGYDDGNFYPNNTVNRAELLKILVEGLGLTSDPDEYKDCFPDVDDDWYAKYVCYAKEEGWVSGYSDGYFHPEDTVNKVEAVKMLLNAYGYEVSEDEDVSDGMPYKDTYSTAWYAGYVKLAFDLGILVEEEGGYFMPDEGRDRGDICMELWEMIMLGNLWKMWFRYE
ncbi:MAG: S-layer protein, partial [uncultured bacterium (gcode 4)]